LSKSKTYERVINIFEKQVSIAPLVTFRIVFGLIMLFSTVRYMALGWVDSQLIDPIIHFSYFGFDWVKPLEGYGMYAVFGVLAISCVAITLGWYYRVFTTLFFFGFTYVELIDITYYLNHYYFVSLVSFLLIFLPANRSFSLDVKRKPDLKRETVNQWCIGILKIQIAIVYVYAGLAKINYDWLVNALPLAIWLPAKSSIPVIGWIFNFKITAYLFSWMGMLFDTFIIGGLVWKKTRLLAYPAVVFFHSMTGILFQIGVFPIVMMFAVLIFFSDRFHNNLIQHLSSLFKLAAQTKIEGSGTSLIRNRTLYPFIILFVLFQLAFPWRYLLYNGNVFWTEEGYRFSWRVMLMEKAGTATFFVKDGENGREGSVRNSQFLNPHQEKQMAMQPDMILQFAHFLDKHFTNQGMADPKVRAEVYVTLNASPSQLLIDPTIDLSEINDGWRQKNWILPFDDSIK